jgi:dihydrofolate reductase
MEKNHSHENRLIGIVAYDRNNVMGVNGGLPWRLPDDLRNFKKITSCEDSVLVCGRKTFETLPPLPGRHVYYMTRGQDNISRKTINFEEVLKLSKTKKVFVVGGSKIYDLFRDYIDFWYVTHVECFDSHIPCVDVCYFNEKKNIDKNNFKIAFSKVPNIKSKENEYNFCFSGYERIK